MSALAQNNDIFQAIADPTRRQVMQILAANEKPISEISAHFPISRTAVVKHLTILEKANLVSARKNGREKIYTLHADQLKDIKDWLQYFELFWDNKLVQLKNIAEMDIE